MNEEKVEKIIKTLDDKKAEDIKLIKIGDLTVVADYFIIASGTSTTHVKALSDEVDFQLKQTLGISPVREEGYDTASWILLDYSDVIVHIFYPEAREFYSLERLWQDGESVDISKIIEN